MLLTFIWRGRSYKRLLEYLFFMWDPSLLDGNSEPIRVLEEGFRPPLVYEVSLFLEGTRNGWRLGGLCSTTQLTLWCIKQYLCGLTETDLIFLTYEIVFDRSFWSVLLGIKFVVRLFLIEKKKFMMMEVRILAGRVVWRSIPVSHMI